MSEPHTGDGEEQIDETGRNPTQREIDERGASEQPVDLDWEDGDR